MESGDRAVAIIPARGGSKRIPKKNIKPFLGKPIICYTIEAALKTALFDKIIVSTDDEQIAEVAIGAGATVPFMRPKELADDYVTSGEAVSYTLNRLQQEGDSFRYLCTLYATAPLMDARYIRQGLEQLKQRPDQASTFSAASMPFPVQRSFKINDKGEAEMFWPEYFTYRSQDLDEGYMDAGQFYWNDLDRVNQPQYQRATLGFAGIPIILPRYRVQDIDTEEDWRVAELLYQVITQQQELESSDRMPV